MIGVRAKQRSYQLDKLMDKLAVMANWSGKDTAAVQQIISGLIICVCEQGRIIGNALNARAYRPSVLSSVVFYTWYFRTYTLFSYLYLGYKYKNRFYTYT